MKLSLSRLLKHSEFRLALLLTFVFLVHFVSLKLFINYSPVRYDWSFTQEQKQAVETALNKSDQAFGALDLNLTYGTLDAGQNNQTILQVYVPVTRQFSAYQSFESLLKNQQPAKIYIPKSSNPKLRSFVINKFEIEPTESDLLKLQDNEVYFLPASQLEPSYKLLSLDEGYYLDGFDSGAIFEKVIDSKKNPLAKVDLNQVLNEDSVLKLNLTGVTALTRNMITKLNQVQDPNYFSAKIGDFLADADYTHISNEVSFVDGCSVGPTSLSFCSPTEFIETLKSSGADIVELTGNHNNDFGASYNASTIKAYQDLGWQTVGGGVNLNQASKPVVLDKDGSKLGILAYNFPDAPDKLAIATQTTAGANPYSELKITKDIAELKSKVDQIIVSIQFWECFAYPGDYVEFPKCDLPIGEQEQIFKQAIQAGANFVIGSSAHQPQTYEAYRDGFVFYGLGNLYFDQTAQPGTTRSLILSNYYNKGKLIQTRVTPTEYDSKLQTKPMPPADAENFLNRLNQSGKALGSSDQ